MVIGIIGMIGIMIGMTASEAPEVSSGPYPSLNTTLNEDQPCSCQCLHEDQPISSHITPTSTSPEPKRACIGHKKLEDSVSSSPTCISQGTGRCPSAQCAARASCNPKNLGLPQLCSPRLQTGHQSQASFPTGEGNASREGDMMSTFQSCPTSGQKGWLSLCRQLN